MIRTCARARSSQVRAERVESRLLGARRRAPLAAGREVSRERAGERVAAMLMER
jgi:hypothetical protein